MQSRLNAFEAVARRASAFVEPNEESEASLHAFDRRNIHPRLPAKVRSLFDDGYYAEATFEAFKFVDKTVQKHAKSKESGVKLMMAAFNKDKPAIQLTTLTTPSEVDEQEGYRFLFSGGVMAIRNPRGHEFDATDDVDVCLDHLAFASLLIRRLEQAGLI
ncbi:TIGR02391 family protein [Xanthomonas sp. D-109]|uniref:TIGR02391 family protein n=1 Tax=Xanthomonas sp. D-109 TaxID=2821274 RepID=UPI001ADB563D|nr:TIGR02391 family protein [Xanthomonas sp. D-109]MBO9881436.1 TIGR02391 family protein [Xanthomonas sp. D-109]